MKLTAPFLIKTISLSVITVALCGYGFYQARSLLNGPQISISSPETGKTVDDPLVTIAGIAHNITYISLNDRAIYVDQKGNFSEKLLLAPGYTIMKVQAHDKFGREAQQLLELTYAPTISQQNRLKTPSAATSTSSSSVATVTLLTH